MANALLSKTAMHPFQSVFFDSKSIMKTPSIGSGYLRLPSDTGSIRGSNAHSETPNTSSSVPSGTHSKPYTRFQPANRMRRLLSTGLPSTRQFSLSPSKLQSKLIGMWQAASPWKLKKNEYLDHECFTPLPAREDINLLDRVLDLTQWQIKQHDGSTEQSDYAKRLFNCYQEAIKSIVPFNTSVMGVTQEQLENCQKQLESHAKQSRSTPEDLENLKKAIQNIRAQINASESLSLLPLENASIATSSPRGNRASQQQAFLQTFESNCNEKIANNPAEVVADLNKLMNSLPYLETGKEHGASESAFDTGGRIINEMTRKLPHPEAMKMRKDILKFLDARARHQEEGIQVLASMLDNPLQSAGSSHEMPGKQLKSLNKHRPWSAAKYGFGGAVVAGLKNLRTIVHPLTNVVMTAGGLAISGAKFNSMHNVFLSDLPGLVRDQFSSWPRDDSTKSYFNQLYNYHQRLERFGLSPSSLLRGLESLL